MMDPLKMDSILEDAVSPVYDTADFYAVHCYCFFEWIT